MVDCHHSHRLKAPRATAGVAFFLCIRLQIPTIRWGIWFATGPHTPTDIQQPRDLFLMPLTPDWGCICILGRDLFPITSTHD